jgi:hypothetical protein
MPVVVDTANRIYEDFSRLLFLHDHREASDLVNELPEESEQFRFLHGACFANIKGSVGLILTKVSAVRISIPLDLSSWPFIPLPRWLFLTSHSCSVTIFAFGFRLFFILLKINLH